MRVASFAWNTLPGIFHMANLTRSQPKGYFFFIYINLFILYIFWLPRVFVAAWGLFSSCGKRRLLFVAVHGLLIVVASRCGAWALGVRVSVVVALGLGSCGSQALERRLSSCGTRA